MRKAQIAITLFFFAALILNCKKEEVLVKEEIPASTIVTVPELKMRIAPNTTAAQIAQLSRGEQVKILQRSAERIKIGKYDAHWYKVTNSAGLSGWVYGAHLAVESTDGDAKTLIEEEAKKLEKAIVGRWEAASVTGKLTPNFVTLTTDGKIEFGSNRKGLQYGKYTVEKTDSGVSVQVTEIQKPMMTDLKAKMVGDTLVFTALMKDTEYKLNLAEKDVMTYKDEAKKKAQEANATPSAPAP